MKVVQNLAEAPQPCHFWANMACSPANFLQKPGDLHLILGSLANDYHLNSRLTGTDRRLHRYFTMPLPQLDHDKHLALQGIGEPRESVNFQGPSRREFERRLFPWRVDFSKNYGVTLYSKVGWLLRARVIFTSTASSWNYQFILMESFD